MSEPIGEFPKLCHLCGDKIGSRTDLDWHGLGNCVPPCPQCNGSGISNSVNHAEALAEALRKYGVHRTNCKAFPAISEEQVKQDCSCGLVAVLAAYDAAREGRSDGADSRY